MLASVLRTAKAIKTNIAIVRAFITLRKMSMQHKELADRIEELKDEI